MPLLRSSWLALALACAGFAQSAEQMESPAVNRVAEKMLCSCGCKLNMACRMDPYPCQHCWENKKKILKMQSVGMSDQAILDQFVKENGKDVLLVEPGAFGALSFYSAAGLGLILVVFAIRRYRRKAAAGGPDDPAFDRYHDQIEKEMAKLD
jgi:cytochrome c-type biogenesis protein CcmH/NrfF